MRRPRSPELHGARAWMVGLGASLSVMVAIPAVASAAVISYETFEGHSTIDVSASEAGPNDISIGLVPGRNAYAIADERPIRLSRAGQQCDRVTRSRVRCRRADDPGIRVSLGRGNDRLLVDRSVKVGVIAFGSKGNDRMYGGGGPDELLGGDEADVLRGAGGADTLTGNEGRDRLNGEGGGDTLILWDMFDRDPGDSGFGGPGNDVLLTQNERERLLDCGPGSRDRASLPENNRSRIVSCEQEDRYRPLGR